jgi:hypothetical protein
MNEETGSAKKQETNAQQGEAKGRGLIRSLVNQLACHSRHLPAQQILRCGYHLAVQKAMLK